MAACGSVGNGEDGSLLPQVLNQLAIRDISDGDILDEILLIMVYYSLDAASYARNHHRCCLGGLWLLGRHQYYRWWANMVLALNSLTLISL